MSDWVERATVLADELDRDDHLEANDRREELAAALRGLAMEVEMAELTLEARLEELAAVRRLLSALSYPLIEVERSVLCLPIVGPIDAAVMEEIIEGVMQSVASRSARWLIIDLTGAQFGDVVAAKALHRLFVALRLIGLEGAVSGVQPELARTLAEATESFGVPAYPSLAAALASVERRRARP